MNAMPCPNHSLCPGGVGCPYDYVQVFAGNDSTGRFLGKFCGTDVPDPVSSTGSMFIQFVTDRNRAFSGFKAQYRVTGEHMQPESTKIWSRD